jgi:tRNA pseudouridine38-40 synthase
MQTKSMGDISKIKEALSILIGEHNFSRYTTTDGVKTSPVRTVYKTGLLQKSNLLLISITASGYLRYMVRSIIGTLLKISQNKISIDQFKESLEGKIIKPLPASLKADARGLYLYKIYYKENPFDNLSIAEKDFNLLPFFKEIDLCQL